MERPLPNIVAILLNLNNYPDTYDCLQSLAQVKYSHLRIIVVDNGSSDDSFLLLQRNFPDVETLRSDTNLGFTGGNNFGIARALQRNADYVLLLNNDTLVDTDFLLPLVRVAEAEPNIGIVGPTILYASDPHRIWYAGGKARYGLCSHANTGELDRKQNTDAHETGFVSGCAMLIKAGVLRKLGLLDDRLFVYHEDTEFCFRARKAGYRCMYVPEARIWHKVSRTCGKQSRFTLYLCTRNELALAARYAPFVVKPGVLAYLLTKKMLKAAMLACTDRGSAAAVGAGILAFLRGSFGPPGDDKEPEQSTAVLSALAAGQSGEGGPKP